MFDKNFGTKKNRTNFLNKKIFLFKKRLDEILL